MPPSKFEADNSYTDQEIVDLYRQMIARGAVAGEEYDIRGRRVRFPGIKTALDVINAFESRIAAAEGPAHNLARLNRS
jgi:hypothetical protein